MAKVYKTITLPNSSVCEEDVCNTCKFKCSKCDGFVLIPINPALLVEGTLYLEATIVTGPTDNNGAVSYVIEIEETLLANPNATWSQCDYRICCNDCGPRFAKVLFDSLQALIADLTERVEALEEA